MQLVFSEKGYMKSPVEFYNPCKKQYFVLMGDMIMQVTYLDFISGIKCMEPITNIIMV